MPARGLRRGSSGSPVWPTFISARLKTLVRGQASRGGRHKTSSGTASPGRLARRRRDQGKGTSRGARDASRDDRTPSGRRPTQCPCFLFGAKEASAGEEYRGIRQRFPFWCNQTKTRRTARRRSPWSPRRHHDQRLFAGEDYFCQDRLYYLSPFKSRHCGIPSRLYLGRGTGTL